MIPEDLISGIFVKIPNFLPKSVLNINVHYISPYMESVLKALTTFYLPQRGVAHKRSPVRLRHMPRTSLLRNSIPTVKF